MQKKVKTSGEKAVTGTTQRGREMHALLTQLFLLCRSITGDGIRETLDILKKRIPLSVHEIPSGTRVFDWVIPKEWNIRGAYIEDEKGKHIVDFADNNLHVVSYSVPIDARMPLAKLQEHLHSIESLPDAIPYVTSYYKETWGFCLSDRQRKKLKNGTYHVVIDSELKEGSLTYGEYIVPGETKQEIFFSTYICHPSMANNELSGPVVSTFLAKALRDKKRRYTYRFVFVPETIGSVTYVSRNLEALKKNTIAGFNVTCVGDEGAYSYLPSRYGNTLADRAAQCVLGFAHPNYVRWSFLDRGSDERQYCSPGVDLPLCSIMRSRYNTYPEYHSSLDNLSFVTPSGLGGSFDVLMKCIELLERNYTYRAVYPCEPQLGKRQMYENQQTFISDFTQAVGNFLAYADGTNDLIQISLIIGVAPWNLYPIIDRLLEDGLIERS